VAGELECVQRIIFRPASFFDNGNDYYFYSNNCPTILQTKNLLIPMEDLKAIKYDVEKLTRHLTRQEQSTAENQELLLEIKHTLVGNRMNGNEGLVLDVTRTMTKVDSLEKIVLNLVELSLFIKWFFGILGASGIGFLVVKIIEIK